MKGFGKFWLVLALLAAVASPALAQNVNSRVIGTAKDTQGAVLPGVTVTAASPALIGSQVTTTEANGIYQFPSLPPGTYTVTFELAGFQTFKRENIVLALGQTLNVDSTMQVASLQETVTVTAASPIVDTQSTSVGSTLNTAKLVGVPSSTDLWGALAQSPGIRMQGFDVGGSHKSQQSGYNAFGVSSQHRVVTEGVDTTEGTGGAGFYQDFFSQSEISVSAAGGDVSMNTPGAAVISTIKAGGNKFKGLVHQSYEGSSFVGDNTNADITKRGGSASPNVVFWENHDDLGGPIMRDKAWFYAAYNHFKIDKVISGVPSTLATDLMTNKNFTTKETWKPSSKDTVIGYYQWQKKAKPLRGLSSTVGPDSTLAQYSPSWMYNGKWERVWSNRLFTQFNVGEFGYIFPMQPSVDFKIKPPRVDLVTGVNSGAGFAQGGTTGPFSSGRAKPQVYGNAAYFVPTANGSHDLKLGFEWLNDMSNFASIGTSGPLLYLDSNGATDEIRLTDLGDPAKLGSSWSIPGDDNRRIALFVQDRWSVNSKLTVTAGVRYDRQQPYYVEAKRDPILTDFFQKQTFPQTTLLTRNTVAPRVGVSFDPMGDGKTAIKAFYGRYYYNFADSFSSVDPGGANWKQFKFNDLNGNRLYDGAQEIGTLVRSGGGVSTRLDQNIKVPHTDEINGSYQRQFWGESSFRVAYVRKMSRNNYATYNLARLGQFTVPVTRTIDLRGIDTGVTASRTFTLFDIPNSLKGVTDNVIATMPDAVDNGAYNYDTVEFAFNKRFSAGLFLDSSFDYTRRDDLRNTNNVSTSPLTQSDPIPNGFYFNIFPGALNRQNTSAWGFRLSSRYELPFQVGLAANLAVQSGWNYARLISVGLPNSGTQNFFETDLNANRSETVPLLSLRVDKSVTFAGHKLVGVLDMFNIINNAAITNFNLNNGARYNQVIQPLDPRTFQLSVRFEF